MARNATQGSEDPVAELMQPVALKIGESNFVNYPNADGKDVIFQVGDIASRDAGSHVSVLVGAYQLTVSVWDGAQIRAVQIDRTKWKVTEL